MPGKLCLRPPKGQKPEVYFWELRPHASPVEMPIFGHPPNLIFFQISPGSRKINIHLICDDKKWLAFRASGHMCLHIGQILGFYEDHNYFANFRTMRDQANCMLEKFLITLGN